MAKAAVKNIKVPDEKMYKSDKPMQLILAEIEIERDLEDTSKILDLIYEDFLRKILWIEKMYPYNRDTLSTYEIMFNIFGFKNTVIEDIIQSGSDSYEDSCNFFKNRNLFGRGEWPIIYWNRYRHSNTTIKDCITYTISR